MLRAMPALQLEVGEEVEDQLWPKREGSLSGRGMPSTRGSRRAAGLLDAQPGVCRSAQVDGAIAVELAETGPAAGAAGWHCSAEGRELRPARTNDRRFRCARTKSRPRAGAQRQRM